MPHCIAPGCTSGYLSNYEKKHFFYVPKDDKSIKLWQTALRRKNFIVKAYQPVCENHFLPEDIIWRRTITDKDGNILGESAPYKIPRLRKGAVPSQFPWTEETTITKEVTMTENEADQPDIARVDIFPNVASETHISFTELIEAVDKSKINMPEQWTYVKHFDNNIKLLIFFLPTCSTIEEGTDRYTIYTKKEVIVNQTETSIKKLKEKLDNAIKNSDFKFQHFMENDYSRPEIVDCVIYYVTGYLSKHILKFINCETCKTAFLNSGQQDSFVVALLSNIKKDERILHPNTNIFYIIKYLEYVFTKHCHRADVFDLFVDNIYTPNLIFPCKKHGDQVLAQIIEFYLKFRMRSYANKINNEKKKMN